MAVLPVTAVIISLNAAKQIGPCLESVAFCDEILVVDSGSSDQTVQIARARGAQVLTQDWLGYGRQKEFAVLQARHDWVLCIDCDERISPDLGEAIRRELARPRATAYELCRRNRFMGRWLGHGEGYPDWTLRLFDRRHANWSTDPVHEKVLASGTVLRLQGDFLHDSAETLESYLHKQNRYTSLQAQSLHAQGRQSSALVLFAAPLMRFIKFYIFKRGFLDGLPGLVHICIGCMNTFNKYAKLLELTRTGSR